LKIGICLRTWGDVGGIGVYTRSIVPGLLALDQKNEYFLYFHDPKHLGEFSDHANVHEIYVPAKNKLIWDQVAIPLRARKDNVDVIYHTKMAVPLLTARKTVMVLHGSERFLYKKFHPKSDLLYFHTIYPLYLKKATAIISVSENARKDVLKIMKLDPAKVKTIHLAANALFRVISDQNQLAEIKEKYKLPENFIIYVGHIYPGKNVGRLFQAFAKARKSHDICLVVAGSMRHKYEHDMGLMKELNIEKDVKLLGYVPQEDLVSLYNLANLTVFPSYYESFPAIPLEANACGCAVITSNTGGTPESAGDAAIYIDPLNVAEIVAAIDSLLSDGTHKTSLIEKGFKNVRRFSWQKTAIETLRLLESMN
jgi:glycosyltransferase involved in cell wall biosynthesis